MLTRPLLALRQLLLRFFGIHLLDVKLDSLLAQSTEIAHYQTTRIDSALVQLEHHLQRQSLQAFCAPLLLAELPPAGSKTISALLSLNGQGRSLAFTFFFSPAQLAAEGLNPIEWCAELASTAFTVHSLHPSSTTPQPIDPAALAHAPPTQLLLIPA